METVARIVILYLFVLLALRIVGKRQLAEMSPFELVVLMFIPEIASQALTGDDYSVTNAIIGVSTLLALVFLTALVTYRFDKLGNLIEGKATLLGQDGRVIPQKLHRERVPPEEIAAAMRKVGIENIEQVKWIVLEADGKISIVPFQRQLPVAPPEEPDN